MFGLIPPDHPRRAQLVAIVQNLLRGFATHQDRPVAAGSRLSTRAATATNVGAYSFHVARPKATNDFHGLGAFLFFSEEISR